MKKTYIYRYYSFGYNYYILRFSTDAWTIRKLRDEVNQFFRYLEELNLLVSKQAAESLLSISKEITTLPSEEKVSKELSERVTNAIGELDKTLDSELMLKEAYILTEKRFSLDKLLNNIQDLFRKDVFNRLPILVQYDLKECGKCIAFNLSTAAAFHMLRATEGTLRFYYCIIIKRKRIKDLMWGPIIEKLRVNSKISRTLLSNLDNIRDNYRNPTQHPDARYDLDEAQDLFGLCIEAINRMIKDLEQKGRFKVEQR